MAIGAEPAELQSECGRSSAGVGSPLWEGMLAGPGGTQNQLLPPQQLHPRSGLTVGGEQLLPSIAKEGPEREKKWQIQT